MLCPQDEEVIRCFMDPSLPDGSGGKKIEAVRVVRDPKTSQGKGIAFVLFATREACRVSAGEGEARFVAVHLS